MAHIEMTRIEGTPEQLATLLVQLPHEKRYRLIEVELSAPQPEEAALADPKAAASIALLRSWIAQAPTDPIAIRDAEEDLRDFKKNMNLPRKEAAARLHFPEVE